MKLKDINLFKQKSKSELEALLPALQRERQEAKLKKTPVKDIKYKIALIKTICSK
jgi:hypothetical protein